MCWSGPESGVDGGGETSSARLSRRECPAQGRFTRADHRGACAVRVRPGLVFLLATVLLWGFGVRVGGAQGPITVDAEGGWWPCLAVVDGNPAIAHAGDTVRFVRANDPEGATWGPPVVVADTAGYYVSLAIVQGNPAIAVFYLGNDHWLYYIRANDPDGSSWSAPITVDSAGNTGWYASMAVVAGNPAIAYWSYDTGDVWFVRALDPVGASWGTPVDAGGGDVYGVSMQVVAGSPAIAYVDDFGFKYVRSADATGAVWGSPMVVDTVFGYGLSLALVDGSPALGYIHVASSVSHLRFVRAEDPQGGAWGVPVVLGDCGNMADILPSLAVVNGNPAISFFGGAYPGHLMYSRAQDADGVVWDPPTMVDASDGVGRHSSLAVVALAPAIAYMDGVNHSLKYVRDPDLWPVELVSFTVD